MSWLAPDLDADPDAQAEDTWTEACNDGVRYDAYGWTEVELIRGDTTSGALYPDYIEYRFGVADPIDALFIVGPNDTDRDGAIDEGYDSDIAVQIGWEPLGDGEGTTSADFFVDYWMYDQVCGDNAETVGGVLDDYHCWSQVDEPQNPGVIGDHWSPESDVVVKASDEYGWFWGTWDGGENVISGQPSTCTDCHVVGQDYNLALTW